jgi:hypothetical protein
MGGGTYDPQAYATHQSTIRSQSTQQVFAKRAIDKLLDPRGIVVRESRDGPDHPESTPIIVGVDVTGSMGYLAEEIAHNGLGTLFQELLDRQPVKDPQLMFMGIGDVYCDSAPLQVSQFESSNVIIPQLQSIYLEGGGGGNGSESYTMAWYFAARHTSIDSFEKRQKRGYLFTLGDDGFPPDLAPDIIHRFIGDELVENVSNRALLVELQRMYQVFHIVVNRKSYGDKTDDHVYSSWNEVLGERALYLEDHTKLAEVIVSTIQVIEGADADVVAQSWSGDTALIVKQATRGLAKQSGSGRVAAAAGVQRY